MLIEKSQIKYIELNQYLYDENNRFIFHFMIETWGFSIVIMEKQGKAFARVYWFNDDDSFVYLDSLSVSENNRRQRLGTELQLMREKIGEILGATDSYLWVLKDSWMYKWYLRRGYKDHIDYDKNNIWMTKQLK